MSVQTSSQVNGVDLDLLVQTVGAIKERPDLAQFEFRSNTRWLGGGRCETQIGGFYGAGSEDTTRTKPFVLQGDEPPVLLGDNTGPNAVEAILHALSSCLSVGVAYNAAAQGIEIDELTFEARGTLDLHGFLGLADDVRPGYSRVKIDCRVKSNASKEQIDSLLNYVMRTSPVLDIIRNPVEVEVSY